MNLLKIAALILASALVTIAQTLPQTQRLYCNFRWEIEITVEKKRFLPFLQAQVSSITSNSTDLVTGSCWLTELDGEPIFITAAHNLGLASNLRPVQVGNIVFDYKTRAISVTSTPYLGLLCYEPEQIGIPFSGADWIAIRPKDKKALSTSKLVRLSDAVPEPGEEVQLFGFPNTAHETFIKTTVASVSPLQDFITLNQSVEPGYSGGVVLDKKGRAVGVIVASEEKQSNALILNKSILKTLKWQPFDLLKVREFK